MIATCSEAALSAAPAPARGWLNRDGAAHEDRSIDGSPGNSLMLRRCIPLPWLQGTPQVL